MAEKKIFITTFDLDRLIDLIEAYRNSALHKKVPIEILEKELERAEIVDPKSVPPDVITMNSTAYLKDLDTGEEIMWTLVFPKDANAEENRISVMAPIGMAVLGYRVGDVIEWKVPGGIRRIKVIQTLYQPEASGNYEI
ncbi:MAG: nucleoside diphosphate kinase regulator [Syntrophaceae bacterium]|nr:nucleoside diphosphate kinase regulator [Syntrophaceae bacterium]